MNKIFDYIFIANIYQSCQYNKYCFIARLLAVVYIIKLLIKHESFNILAEVNEFKIEFITQPIYLCTVHN